MSDLTFEELGSRESRVLNSLNNMLEDLKKSNRRGELTAIIYVMSSYIDEIRTSMEVDDIGGDLDGED